MFNSQVLEIAIGLVFVFLIASLLASVVREFIEGLLKTRAVQLERGIRILLDDPTGKRTTEALFGHPQLFALFDGVYDPRRLTGFMRFWKTSETTGAGRIVSKKALRMPLMTNLPSYIPSRNFALALLDLLGRHGTDVSGAPPPSGRAVSMDTLLAHANALAPGRVRDALLVALNEAQGDFDRARTSLEAWFDSNMDRVSGWYKRETQVVLLLIGLSTAALFNIDTIAITRDLANNNTVRAQVVLQAEATRQTIQAGAQTRKEGDPLLDAKALADAKKGLSDLIGWPRLSERKSDAMAPDAKASETKAFDGKASAAKPSVAGASDAKASAANASDAKASDLRASDAKLDASAAVKPDGNPEPKIWPQTAGEWFWKVVGLLITGLAISLGAPFWFDLLNKMMVVRSTVKPFEKSPAEGSEDRRGGTPSADRLEPRPSGGGPGIPGGGGGGRVVPDVAGGPPVGSVRLAVDLTGLTGPSLTVDGKPAELPLNGLADLPLSMGDIHQLKFTATDAAGNLVSKSQDVRVTLDDDAHAISW